MGKARWTDSVQNEVLHRVKEERNILPTIKRKDWSQLAYELPSETRY